MMPGKPETIGLLLMAYGSPEDLSQMEAYLMDVRGGRAPSPGLIEEIGRRYKMIGGKSPLLERTSQQARALEDELNKRFANGKDKPFKAFVGMRHWQPRIHSAINQMAAANIHKAVAVVMAPHNSRMSTGKYYQMLDEALGGQKIDFIRIQSWHKHPALISAIVEKMEIGLDKFGDTVPYVVFTAHSLPAQILEMGDPYDDQLNETARLLAERLKLRADQWQFCYQSAGENAIPWLGPQIEEVVVELANKGEKNLLVVPVGFVCDHVEVLYDIDIRARQIAEKHGARLERTPSLNDSPTFVAALADVVQEHLSPNKP